MTKQSGIILFNENKEILLLENYLLPIDYNQGSDDLINSLISLKNKTGLELEINDYEFINLGEFNALNIYAVEYLGEINSNIKYNWFDIETLYKKITDETIVEFIKRIEKFFLEDDEEEVDEIEEPKSLAPEPINFKDMNIQEKRDFYLKYLSIKESLGVNHDVLEWSNIFTNLLLDQAALFCERLKTDKKFYSETLRQVNNDKNEAEYGNLIELNLDINKMNEFIDENISKSNKIKLKDLEVDFNITIIENCNTNYYGAFFNDMDAKIENNILYGGNIFFDLYLSYEYLDLDKESTLKTLKDFLNKEDEDIVKKINGMFSHEFTHVLEFKERMKNNDNIFRDRIINFLVSLIRNDKLSKISMNWRSFLNLIYLDFSYEINARVSQLYTLIKDKDIKSQSDFFREVEKTEVWKDMIQLKEFDADEFYENFKYNVDDDVIEDVMKDVPGNNTDKVLITLLKKWDEYIDIVNEEYKKYGDISIDKLSEKELKKPKLFLKYWENKFHKDFDNFKLKIDRLYSKF